MSNLDTKKMLRPYEEMAEPAMFLSRFFETPQENFHDSETVEIDILRRGEPVAIVVTDPSTGARINSVDVYTNKQFKPPVYEESIVVNNFDQFKRAAGQNPFERVPYIVKAQRSLLRGAVVIRDMILRSIELQASQVFQTGVLTLKDETGANAYTLDYSPKTTHFPTAAVSWALSTTDIFGDIKALVQVIRTDGKRDATDMFVGDNAFENMLKNDDIKERFDNRRIDPGLLGLAADDDGGTGGANFQGRIKVGNVQLNVWTYGAVFDDPQTGAGTQYLDPDKVVIRAKGRLDLTFGNIPRIVAPDPRVAPLMSLQPARVSSVGGGVDLIPNAWVDPKGNNVYFSLAARPLCIPTAIDSFGCITTIP